LSTIFSSRVRLTGLFTGFQEAVQDLVAVESLSAAVFFHHHIGDIVASFIAGKPAAAIQALAAATYGIAIAAFPGINNAIL
jgi:hypothetical protein